MFSISSHIFFLIMFLIIGYMLFKQSLNILREDNKNKVDYFVLVIGFIASTFSVLCFLSQIIIIIFLLV